jgi:7,8-dihydroneopterin aldolase/epimerase/oxygenase
MFTVHLNKMLFYGYHGVHKEEAIVGGEFEVAISISFPSLNRIKTLDDTINYVAIFELVKNRFLQPEKLLETLAQNMVEDIYTYDTRISLINISIEKLNAPISNFIGRVGVTYSKSFS